MSLFILVLPTKDHLHMVMAKHYEGLLAAVVRETSHHGKPQGDSGWRCERGLIIVYGLLLGDLGEDPRKRVAVLALSDSRGNSVISLIIFI